VERAQLLGLKSMALTNINSTADCWDFVLKCQEANIKPILGVEIRNENELCYILLAKNNAGLLAIQSFLSFYKQRKLNFPKKPPFESEDIWVIYTYENHPEIQQLGNQELIGLRKEDLTKLSWQEHIHADCWVILHPVTYQDKTAYDLHRILRAIAKNTLL
jgi:DNA polymerase-3 subunit alpha